MKTLLVLLLATLLISSCNKKETGYQKLILENNLGVVELKLPSYYDTLFTWIHYSDCGDACARVKYRFQKKDLPVFKETGFHYEPLKDSVCQLTISHLKLMKPLLIADTTLPAQYIVKLKNETFESRFDKFLIDTILKVDDKNFAVIAFESYDSTSKAEIKILKAATDITGNILEFNFELRSSNHDSIASQFLNNSFNAIKSIKLEKK